jgi:hypothetical protein
VTFDAREQIRPLLADHLLRDVDARTDEAALQESA